jgi:hypothetical protein
MHRVLIHRLERVGDVRDALAVGDQNLVDLVRLIYPHVEETMHRAAGRTVLAGIEYLAEDGAVSASALERFRRQMIDLGVKNDA